MSPRENMDGYDDYDDADDGLESGAMMPEASWADTLQANFGVFPWWIMSGLLHVMVLVLAGIIWATDELPEEPEVIIPVEQVEEPPPPPEPEEEIKRDIEENKNEVEVPLENIVENPLVTTEDVEITTHNETENNMDNQNARGEEDAISDIPCGGKGVVGSMGLGGGGGGAFGFRGGGGRKRAAVRGGGNAKSESAVNAALRWLAKNQEADGSWAIQKWGGSFNEGARVGLTGLALLAFLGAGHTEIDGEYRNKVRLAITYLISKQEADGCLGPNRKHAKNGSGYNHGIAGLALAEATGMAPKVKRTRVAAQKAVDFSLNVMQREYSGWRYVPKQAADLSVTGWYVMQLKSAKIAKLKVGAKGFQGALQFLDTVTEKGNEETGEYGGRARYSINKGGHSHYNETMTAVGMLCRQFMGQKRTDPLLMGGGDYLKKHLPKWGGNGTHMFYYWYYGTLVMFQMGGNYWKAWNANLRDMLISNQIVSKDPTLDGSWEPIKDGVRTGRAYSTALCALCLEVYYRYKRKD